MNSTNQHPAFSRLPKRLTIAFDIWALYDTPGESAAYHDIDKMVREHTERGFNCMRIDSGAGLIHDLQGNPLGPVEIGDPFSKYGNIIRQMNCTGEGGECDILKRLIELCEAAKKYDVYIILSSWYYLHTFWMLHDEQLNDKLFAIPPIDRFMEFAKLLDYILCELESKGLDDRIAFTEIFNEADGLFFINGYGGYNGLSDEELEKFRIQHEKSIDMLKQKHPQLLFAFDSYTPWSDVRQIPQNLDVYNFHSYYMWNIYDKLDEKPEFFTNAVTVQDVRCSRNGRRPAAADWYQRITKYNNLDSSKEKEIEMFLESEFKKNRDIYRQAVQETLANLNDTKQHIPDVPLVCGEGVSYIGSKKLVWEENSDEYWNNVEETVLKYKDFGLWGTVIRTCCGPEDPSWNMCADRLLHINKLFLE